MHVFDWADSFRTQISCCVKAIYDAMRNQREICGLMDQLAQHRYVITTCLTTWITNGTFIGNNKKCEMGSNGHLITRLWSTPWRWNLSIFFNFRNYWQRMNEILLFSSKHPSVLIRIETIFSRLSSWNKFVIRFNFWNQKPWVSKCCYGNPYKTQNWYYYCETMFIQCQYTYTDSYRHTVYAHCSH